SIKLAKKRVMRTQWRLASRPVHPSLFLLNSEAIRGTFECGPGRACRGNKQRASSLSPGGLVPQSSLGHERLESPTQNILSSDQKCGQPYRARPYPACSPRFRCLREGIRGWNRTPAEVRPDGRGHDQSSDRTARAVELWEKKRHTCSSSVYYTPLPVQQRW